MTAWEWGWGGGTNVSGVGCEPRCRVTKHRMEVGGGGGPVSRPAAHQTTHLRACSMEVFTTVPPFSSPYTPCPVTQSFLGKWGAPSPGTATPRDEGGGGRAHRGTSARGSRSRRRGTHTHTSNTQPAHRVPAAHLHWTRSTSALAPGPCRTPPRGQTPGRPPAARACYAWWHRQRQGQAG
jgi:hypothetical protein